MPPRTGPRQEEAAPSDPSGAAHALALRLLERRARTRAELATALARRGVPRDVSDGVLERLERVGLLDDADYAQAFVASRHRDRGLARRALGAELRRRGVAEADAAAAIATISGRDEEERARALVTRRAAAIAALDPPVRARRLLMLLARKGYPAELAVRLVREVVDAETADLAATSDRSGSSASRPASPGRVAGE